MLERAKSAGLVGTPKRLPSGVDGKVTPDILQTIILDEIAGRLAAFQNFMDSTQPAGDISSLTLPVSDHAVEVDLGTWITATIFNDGPSDIQPCLRSWQHFDSNAASLRTGDSLPINKHRRVVDKLYLVCDTGGSASVRIFYQ